MTVKCLQETLEDFLYILEQTFLGIENKFQKLWIVETFSVKIWTLESVKEKKDIFKCIKMKIVFMAKKKKPIKAKGKFWFFLSRSFTKR